jgi:hypothetical protein
LVQTLVDGIAVRTNRPVLQHWLDFLLMAVPQFQPALQAVVGPLNDCICRQLSASLRDVLHASSQGQSYTEDLPSFTTDAEMIMLLNGLERMVSLSLAYTSELSSSDDETPTAEKPVSENSGLLGMVSNVFGSDNTQQLPEDQLTVSLSALAECYILIHMHVQARSPAYRSLDEGIRVLYSIWGTFVWTNPQTWTSKDESLSVIYNRTRMRCRRVLEHLFRVQSAEVFESIVECWSKDLPVCALMQTCVAVTHIL